MRIPTHIYANIGLSWEDSEFDQEEAPLSPEQIKVHAQCCKFFRDLKEELADAMATAGSGGSGSEEGGDKRSKTHPMKLFWSLLVSQLCQGDSAHLMRFL